MKKIILVCNLFFLFEIYSFSQTENFKIIYIDNSKPTREDVLNEAIYDKISTIFDKIKANDQKFILFLSNGVNYTITYSPNSLDKITDKLYSTNTIVPDQFYDVEKMRDQVYERLKKIEGNVSFEFFIIGETAGNICSKAAPLFKFFPAEIAYAFNKKVDVTINCPLATLPVKPEEIKTALNFYRTEYGQENITYKFLTF